MNWSRKVTAFLRSLFTTAVSSRTPSEEGMCVTSLSSWSGHHLKLYTKSAFFKSYSYLWPSRQGRAAGWSRQRASSTYGYPESWTRPGRWRWGFHSRCSTSSGSTGCWCCCAQTRSPPRTASSSQRRSQCCKKKQEKIDRSLIKCCQTFTKGFFFFAWLFNLIVGSTHAMIPERWSISEVR